ncbi:pyruvate:ferredoxin (flavodoxin) oxidoreductase [Parafrankia colletiae]|uniref:Pyruvate:ferredoxin (Flavodoxin) oxidoreductase n=1 Tax=Parafrankia colletiae TaxID=573497 RepID=A0A1S1QVJ0_9ACTN|nr:pyruvate:ferredoxin (flavodoxin) oxidoreductase [Parafrankia colletiae]MCK9899581.1 pyruvate:ferredoxin (flavodoxin) oxidoreductase [Frankia sp. Cpl3]OHV37990.1 pyruvate:ferredoxin (flavodoxin) oxidoreductase [Parafrankia colletiae]
MGQQTIDGNEAATSVAYRASEVIAIYPITPASGMGELADAWSAKGRPNLWGTVPEVVQLQSEGGAAGAVHGALQAGALSTTFTASQGLLLMLPNMFKIAGELTPMVLHVAARTLATHALSIFGDHSDVMAARTTGFAMLAAASPQETHDLAAVAHAATLASRIPFLHFFDGFRTSHELNEVTLLDDATLAALLPAECVDAHRRRALSPDHPVIRGTTQDPDTFFQSREAANGYYAAVPGIVQRVMDQLAASTGRAYRLFEYHGHPEAERVAVIMGSGRSAVRAAVDRLVERGERVGFVQVRLYRPFDTTAFLACLPPTVRSVAVLDRTKEPGAAGEPLRLDVLAALAERPERMPRVIGARYGLASKEFTPAMAAAVFDELDREQPRREVTVGIHDDVTNLSLTVDDDAFPEPDDVLRAVFYGLGSDGTVGATRTTAGLVDDRTSLHAQAYFVFDSKKSGSMTVSHLRLSPEPIDAPWLIRDAQYVGCHQAGLLDRVDVLAVAARGATILLNSPHPAERVWDHLPAQAQRHLLEKNARLFVVDADRVAKEAGIPGIVSPVLQTCFLALSGLFPAAEAVDAVRDGVRAAQAKRGEDVLRRNVAAIEAALGALGEVDLRGREVTGGPRRGLVGDLPVFVQQVTARIAAGEGNLIPVSALPADGTFPVGTARYEKRAIARELPVWDPELCVTCGKCAIVCPHAAIRMTLFEPERLDGAPESFRHTRPKDARLGQYRLTIQVAPDDCTGCGICVEACPAKSREIPDHRALDMVDAATRFDDERTSWAFHQSLPAVSPELAPATNVRGSQLREPLFEFSGACAGCGESPYLKLLTQLFGDRIVVANATGCSSIYGGNLPTTPWTTNAEGRGPAWANSLFEDNAEFGLGMRLALDARTREARRLLRSVAGVVGDDLVGAILDADQSTETGIGAQRARIAELRRRLGHAAGSTGSVGSVGPAGAAGLAGSGVDPWLDAVLDDLVAKSVWIVGGDGWAYDIGFGGLDHVLASGRDVNVLVLDTEGYSNTGGQASKSTPRAAVAKFAMGGKRTRKKDLGLVAAAYGDVYVAQVALGANDQHTVRAFNEAAAWPGPSLIVAYSHCIAHGIDMTAGMAHQKAAVRSGYWPLYRFDPAAEAPFSLDSRAPSIPFSEFAATETRFTRLGMANPAEADRLGELAQDDIHGRWQTYEREATRRAEN